MTMARVAFLMWLLVAAGFAGGVRIEKTDATELELSEEPLPLYRVTARTYQAEVYADGRTRLLAGKTVLLDNLLFELGREVKVLGNIRAEGGNRILLLEGTPLEEGPVPDLPGIALSFGADTITLAPAGLKGKKLPSIHLSGVFGEGALAVRNLRDGREDALPTDRICSKHRFSFYEWLGQYWPEVEVTYADGTRLQAAGISGLSHSAIGGRDPHRNEKLKGLRGYWGLREAKEDSRITLKVSPAAGKGIAAAPYCTISPDKPRGFFYESERALFHLEFPKGHRPAGAWQAAWDIEDHRQRRVTSGKATIASGAAKATLDLTPPEMGHFRARIVLSRPDTPAAKRLLEVEFSRIRPEKPALRDLAAKGSESEMLWANILGMRGIRLNPSWANTWRQHHRPDGSIDWDKAMQAFDRSLEPARAGTLTGLFSFTGLDWADDLKKGLGKRDVAEAKRDYLTTYAREAAKRGLHVWEPVNEPNLGLTPQRYIDEVLKLQYPAVKAGNPKANFLGGSICGLNNYGWLRKVFELGGHKHFDGISLHPYTGDGFQEAYRAELEQWWRLLRDYGRAEQGIWLTESAWHRGWGYQDYVYDRFGGFRQSQAANGVHMHLNAEGMGIPRDRIYVFYLVEHGYNDFYLIRRKAATAAAIAIQVMNECLRDAKFVREIPMPGKGHHVQLYRDDTRTVAVAFTNGETMEQTFVVDGQVAVTDLMGNRRIPTLEGGVLRIAMSGDPTYIAMGPKGAIEPVWSSLRVQANLAIPTLGATVVASSVAKPKGKPALPPSAAISGDWTCYSSAGAWNGSRRGWDEADEGKDTFPDAFEVKLPQPVAVARVRVVHDYGAWERLVRDYDVQAHVGGAWKTVDRVRDNRTRFIVDHQFKPVTTDRVRILVHGVNSCLFENMAWIPKLTTLRAVEVYGPPGGEAKAFFVHAPPRRRILKPGDAAKLTFTLQNATKAELAGDVRLLLPKGVSAAAASKKVTLPAKGTADCTFTVQLADDAAEGLHTVLAEFRTGGALSCPDREPIVLCCKKAKGK